MKKHISSLFGLFLLLFNNFSFSMQPDQERSSCINQQESPELSFEDPSVNEQIAQKFIAHFPEACRIVNTILRMEKFQAATPPDTNKLRLKNYFYHMFLLVGAHGNNKGHVAKAIATLLHRKTNIVDFSQINIENPDTRPTIEDQLAPTLRKQDKPRVVILENIERLSTKGDGRDNDEGNNPILRLRPFFKEIERQKRDKFVVLATTSDLDKIPHSLRNFFIIIEILKDFIEKLDIPVETRESTQSTDSMQLPEEKQESPICTAPNYILWRILTHLPTSDVVSFLSTCQYLKRQPIDPNLSILLRGKTDEIKEKIQAIESQGKFIHNKRIIFIQNSHKLEKAQEFFAHFSKSNKRAEKISLLKILPYFKSKLSVEVGQLPCLQKLCLEETLVNTATIAKLCSQKNIQQRLKALFLSANRFNILPKEIGKLATLKELHIQMNNLAKLPQEIGQLTNLKILNLSENMLNSLPPKIGQLINLTNLDLSANYFKNLPKEINNLAKLKTLNLCYNKHINPHPEIGQLPNLQILNLSNTLFSPKAISTLCTYPNIQQHLKKLELCDNELTTLPPEIKYLTNLQHLRLCRNNLTKFPSAEIKQLDSLQIIDLAFNHLPKEQNRLFIHKKFLYSYYQKPKFNN